MKDIGEIRKESESLLEELEREFYLSYSGQKENLEITSIFNRYTPLFSKEILMRIKEEWLTSTGEMNARMRELLYHLTSIYETAAVRELTDSVSSFEAGAMLTLDSGEQYTFRYASSVMKNEEDRPKRQEIYLKWLDVVEEMNPMLLDGFSTTHRIRQELGYGEYREMTEGLSNFSLTSLEDLMKAFLARTGDLYDETIPWIVKKKLNIPMVDAEKHDLGYIFRGTEYDSFFPGDSLLETVSGFITSMGLDPVAKGNIRYDIEKREKKSPRAFCSTISIPSEVVLVIMPAGGWDDYSSFLHELGHALHYGYVDAGQPFEYRCLGDNSVTEGYAMCMDHLLLDPVWLKKVLKVKDIGNFLWFGHLRELFMLRRYAAKLTYEIALHSTRGAESMRERYEALLDAATGVRNPGTLYLYDVDPDFYCARYIRAWLFEAALSHYLRENFDEDWFLNPRAGHFLKILWEEGQRRNVEELATDLGFEGLTIEPLIGKIEAHLG